jgi:hypothetical protein
LPPTEYYDIYNLGTRAVGEAVVQFNVSDSRAVLESREKFFPILVYGLAEVVVPESGGSSVVIPLRQNTNRVNIIVTGLPLTDSYVFSIEDNNGAYDFVNDDFVNCDDFSYKTPAIVNNNELRGMITVLKLAGDRRPKPSLKIYNEGGDHEIFSYSLIDLIRGSNLSYDFDNIHEHEVRIDFSIEGIITINDWVLILNDNELEPAD